MEKLAPTAADIELQFAVIIPCHNVEATLAPQLESLVAQTWSQPWGIVVVDNNSTDGTREIAENYASRGVRIVIANTGRGVAYARNSGVRETKARTFAFCDGDDIVQPGWVTAMADGLIHASIVSGPIETESLNPAWLAHSRPMPRKAGLPTFGRIGFAAGCNSGMTRETFDALGGYDEDFVGLEDIEFSLRALANGNSILYLPEALVAYRLRGDMRSLWRQGFFYGRGRPELKERAREHGLPVPASLETWKSWAWLMLHIPKLRNRAGRFQWLWVLANRLGVIRGNLTLLLSRLSPAAPNRHPEHHLRMENQCDT